MGPADQNRPTSQPDEQEPDYRFTLANERTFLAWIRTSLALIAAGVAVVQLVPAFSVPGLRHGLGLVLTICGGALAVLAVRRWQQVQTAIRRDADLPASPMPRLLTVIIVAAAVMVLIAIYTQP